MSLPKGLRFRVLRRDGFTCHYCGRSAPDVVLHVDHVIPRARGGSDDARNLVTACTDCNVGKSALHATEDGVPVRSERLLVGGPLDGERRSLAGRRPFLWLVRLDDGRLHEEANRWVVLRDLSIAVPRLPHPQVVGHTRGPLLGPVETVGIYDDWAPVWRDHDAARLLWRPGADSLLVSICGPARWLEPRRDLGPRRG